jgi:hypothetical protein
MGHSGEEKNVLLPTLGGDGTALEAIDSEFPEG